MRGGSVIVPFAVSFGAPFAVSPVCSGLYSTLTYIGMRAKKQVLYFYNLSWANEFVHQIESEDCTTSQARQAVFGTLIHCHLCTITSLITPDLMHYIAFQHAAHIIDSKLSITSSLPS